MLRRFALVFAMFPVLVGACGSIGDGEEGAEDAVGATSAALSASDPLSAAVGAGCSTSAVKGLSTQLVEELQCLRPGTMKSIDGLPGVSLGASVFPYLQAPAADALVAAQKARGTTLTVNSALRALPQQYLLYQWYKQGRCGIVLAAAPGQSNHESGLAVDVAENASWRSSLEAKGFDWLGAGDPPHFDYVKGGVDIRGLSVRAFQRLWNRNHPEDPLAEDGVYGSDTEKRLLRSPIGGFPKGASCSGEPAPPTDEPPDPPNPGMREPVEGAGTSAAAPTGPANEKPQALPRESRGCATQPGPAGASMGSLAALALLLGASRRRRVA